MSISFNSTLAFTDFVRGYNIIMFSMWGIGVDIPRLVIRYGKAYPLSINIHSISMLMIGLFTIMYVIAEIVMYTQKYGASYTGLTGAAYGQYIVSIILGCLVVVQFLLGFLTRVKMFKSKLSKSFFAIKLVHVIMGYLIEIVGKVVATLIVNTSVDDMTFRAWLFLMAGMAIIFIVLEVIYRAQSKTIIFQLFFRTKNKHAKYLNEIYQNLIEKKQKFENYKARGVRYVIIDNSMYYIDQNFMHPGGQSIFNILNGKEINYYLKGAKSISPNYPRHLHTKYVAKFLQNRIIGDIGVDSIVINQKIATEVVDWKIVSSIKTNYAGTYLVTFETDSGEVRQDLRLQNFGKYVMMGCMTEQILNKTERPYYFCMSLSTHQLQVLDNLRKYYKYYYFNEAIEEDQPEVKQFNAVSNRLPFFIREVKFGLFTKFLLNAPKDRVFSINGPFGKGLNLKERSSGYYMLIASDMGVSAYIDFLSFMLQKTLYDLIKMKASSPSLRKINQSSTSYDVFDNLRVLFVGSFSTSGQFYLNTVLKELYYLNLKHGLKTFNMMLHYSNGETEHEIKMIRDLMGKEFFTELIAQEQPDRIFFSGAATLEHALRRLEPQLKLKREIEYL